MRMLRAFLFVVVIFAISACSKEEGEGGTSVITGKVFVNNYNSDYTVLKEQYYAQEEDVYIIYGNDKIYSDKFETNFDGSYRFQYLQKGKYKIYAYSKDTTLQSPTGRIPVTIEVEITGNYQAVEAEDLVIIE